MSEALRQKTSARRVLLILAGLLAAVLALQGIASVGPSGFKAFAQSTTSPSPSGRSIEIINPDATTSTEISAKNDGVDSAYHLVAWVNTPTTGDVVEFKYRPDDQNVDINIQCTETGTNQARFVSPDTYECHWNLANVPEGSEAGTLRAVLYSGTTSVASDEEAVTIDRTGQTVEITYPVNGGSMGFYTTPEGTSVGMIDFRTSGSAGTDDEGTQDVVPYYSISAPGTEPDFLPCDDGPQETTGGSPDSARCTLPGDDPDTTANEAHRPDQVTAVAVVARDISEGAQTCPDPNPGNPLCDEPDPDSADAHRVLGYSQDPSTVSLDRQTQQATPGTCSQVITATVFDQTGRKVVAANVDVHGQGPTDNLFFDDPADNSSEHQPPDQNNHTTEATVDCESETSPKPFSEDEQGKHDQAAPASDIKHIESTVDGTDDNGQFKFQLYTADSGTTQFTVWADEDGNDRFCSEEAHTHGSIGWNASAPSPTGVAAEDASCPKPGPTGSPTATATATPTATPTGTPTGTATQSPGATRTVTLSTNKSRMPAGRKVTFSGNILSNTASCQDNEFVQIRRRIHGTNQYRDLFGTQTDSQGNFSVERRARKSADYIAIAPATQQCAEASSDPVTVLVKVVLQILPSDKNPERGTRIRIKSSVRPQHDDSRLILQRKKGRRWVKVAVTRTNKRSIGNFFVKANFNRRTFRTKWPKQHEDHISNTSRAVTIRTR